MAFTTVPKNLNQYQCVEFKVTVYSCTWLLMHVDFFIALELLISTILHIQSFQKELGKRTSSVQTLKRSARELMDTGRDDTAWVKVQLQELSTRWDTVCALSVTKQTRLQQALKQVWKPSKNVKYSPNVRMLFFFKHNLSPSFIYTRQRSFAQLCRCS